MLLLLVGCGGEPSPAAEVAITIDSVRQLDSPTAGPGVADCPVLAQISRGWHDSVPAARFADERGERVGGRSLLCATAEAAVDTVVRVMGDADGTYSVTFLCDSCKQGAAQRGFINVSVYEGAVHEFRVVVEAPHGALLVEPLRLHRPDDSVAYFVFEDLEDRDGCPAELLIRDPEGRRSGFDPTSGLVLSQIPRARYDSSTLARPRTEPCTEPDALDLTPKLELRRPAAGSYDLAVVGVGEGRYRLVFGSVAPEGDGPAVRQLLEGTIGGNDLHRLRLDHDGAGTWAIAPAAPAGEPE